MENDNSTPKKRDRTFYRDKASLRKNANRFLQRHGTQTGDYLVMIAILNGRKDETRHDLKVMPTFDENGERIGERKAIQEDVVEEISNPKTPKKGKLPGSTDKTPIKNQSKLLTIFNYMYHENFRF